MTLRFDHQIAVTPLSIDLTSRVDLQALAQRFKVETSGVETPIHPSGETTGTL